MKTPLLILLWVCARVVFSQEILENNPPSLKWSHVSTPHFRVIFPKGFEEQGMRMANTLEFIHDKEARTLGSLPRRISVILQNQSAISNGFVSIFPRRSEFYAMPSQDYNFTGTVDWLDMLASHEYRHVVQYQHALRGFNRAFYYLFGATTFAGMAQAAAPDWFWEGDAVVTETAFTRGGRGRIPNFSIVFKTNLLEGREFNYHKQYLRSYKHNIPDHYVLGYHMVSYLRKRTNDPGIWGKITSRAWNVPFIPFAFSNAIKKETGLYVRDLYREMVQSLKTEWQKEQDQLSFTPFTMFPVERRNTYTDYLYPQAIDDGKVLVMKKGIGDVEQFVVLDGKNEERVFVPGFINDSGMISASGSLVVWNEYGYDPRWNVRNYSLIKAYDFHQNRKYVIGGKKGRYGSASVSPDGKKIVAVRTDSNYKTAVVVFSFPDGAIEKIFSNPGNNFYSMPRWADDGSGIVVLKTSKEGRSVVMLDPSGDTEKELVAPSDENVGYPVIAAKFLFYNSPATGIDNIFAIDLSTGKKYQVTSSKYGAYNPCISSDGLRLYYNEQTRDGLDAVSIPFDPSAWREPQKPLPSATMWTHLVEQEGTGDIFRNIPRQDLPVRKFSKIRGLVNPYTWGLVVSNDLANATVGISSQDLLSTTKIEAGYIYNISEQASAYQATVSYQGLFPIIDVSGTVSDRRVKESDNLTFKWHEQTAKAGLRVPFTTTSSRFAGKFEIANSVGLTHVTDFINTFDEGGRTINNYVFTEYIDNGNLVFNDFNIEAFRLMKRSRRDINSKWGQRFSLQHFSTPYGGDFNGNLLAFTGVLYFPGLFKHHSLWGYGAFQQTKMNLAPDNYWFQNSIPIPRGQSVYRFETFYSSSVNYTLPVWYPDISLGPVLNIQRFRLNGFVDYGYGSVIMDYGGSNPFLSDLAKSYTSIGVEGKVDINIMRFLPQFDIGIRYTKGLDPSTSEFEVLIGTFNF
jgi:hypothetical protein